MKTINIHNFGKIRAYEFGYSPIGNPLMTVFAYVVDGILIDTAQRHMQQQVVDIFREREKPTHLLLTHHHEDHCANADRIKREFDIPVIAHPLTAKYLSTGFRIRPYQHLVWGQAERTSVTPYESSFGQSEANEKPDFSKCYKPIQNDNYEIVPIHTPGHSDDHCVYFVKKEGWIFSGDMFLGERIKYFRADENFQDQIESLQKILSLDFDSLFCGHHPKVTGGKESLRKKLQFLQDLYGKITELHAKGLSEKNIIKQLDKKQDTLVKWITLKNACFANMIRSALSGLKEN